jgi:2,4-dienoyl-CoA reductase-like NADH-dependent reductase (Old Yellow Enzyme family)
VVIIAVCEKAYLLAYLLATKEAMEMTTIATKCHEKIGCMLLSEMRIEKVGTRIRRVHSGSGCAYQGHEGSRKHPSIIWLDIEVVAEVLEKVKVPFQLDGTADAAEVAAEAIAEAVADKVEVGKEALKDPDMVWTAVMAAVDCSASCRALESTRKKRSEPSVRQKARKSV